MSSPQSSEDTKLFVGGLTRTATEEEVKGIFQPYGQVSEIFLMKDVTTGLRKGCGFVKFSTKDEALAAINALNRAHTMAGSTRPLEVRFAESKKQILGGQIGDRNQNINSGFGGRLPSRFGGAIAPQIPRQNSKWKEYMTADGRPYYHNEVSGVTQWDRPAELDGYFSQASAAVTTSGESNGPPGANIFIFHVPNDWVQTDLVNAFSPFGHVVSAMISTDKTTGRNRGFAFVSFDDIGSAANAVLGMNGFMVNNKRLKVTIKRGEEQYVQHLLQNTAGPQSATFNPATIGGGCLSPQMSQFEFGTPGMIPPVATGPLGGQSFAGYSGYSAPQAGRYAPY